MGRARIIRVEGDGCKRWVGFVEDIPERQTAAPPDAAACGYKRVLDSALILLFLPLWLPAMLLTALWIRSVSPGPVFFRQKRIGLRGRTFEILKFRSMRVNAETSSHQLHVQKLMRTDQPMTKLDHAGDKRLIPGGRFLRALGLDELPQLINVLQGEMSLVGPRPCTPYEFDGYAPWQRARVNVPPGLTGYWQVNGKNRTTFSEMIAMDIFYSKNASPILDLAILLRTGPAILGQVLDTHFPERFLRPARREYQPQPWQASWSPGTGGKEL